MSPLPARSTSTSSLSRFLSTSVASRRVDKLFDNRRSDFDELKFVKIRLTKWPGNLKILEKLFHIYLRFRDKGNKNLVTRLMSISNID